MGVENFVELLWRIHTKPGVVIPSPGKEWYGEFMNSESAVLAESVYVFTWPLPDWTILSESTFENAI